MVLEQDLKTEYQRFSRTTIAVDRTATDARIGTRMKSKHGPVTTSSRTSRGPCVSRISASNTSWMGATLTRISRSSPSTTAARTLAVARGRGSVATAGGAAVAGARSIRAWRMNFYELVEPA